MLIGNDVERRRTHYDLDEKKHHYRLYEHDDPAVIHDEYLTK